MSTKLLAVLAVLGVVSSVSAGEDEVLPVPPRERPGAVTPVPGPTPALDSTPLALGPTPAVPGGPWFGPEPALMFDSGPHGDARVYGRAEFLLWWMRDTELPPLLTTGPLAGTVVVGNEQLDTDAHAGGRATLGVWLVDPQSLALETRYFQLERRSAERTVSSPGDPILTRPFFDVAADQENVAFIAFPNFSAGDFAVKGSSELWGTEVNVAGRLVTVYAGRLDVLAGFRYLELSESLDLIAVNRFAPGVGGGRLTVLDSFGADSRFYGGQVGLNGEVQVGRWFVTARGQVALGGTDQIVRVRGASTLTAPSGASISSPNGLLALPSNIGRSSDSEFSVVPELGINLGYAVTEQLRVHVGYNLLYWTHAVRAADQIDPVLNFTQFNPGGPVGPIRPAVPFTDDDFWVQGLTFGVEFIW
jgi:hypothetical protein